MKNFIIVLLSSILSAVGGAIAFACWTMFEEDEGNPILENYATTTKKKAYENGRRDGIQQTKEEIMTNLRAE